MKNLIVCLGYNPKDNGEILPLLQNRLEDTLKLCRENPNSTLLLMGGNTFRKQNPDSLKQTVFMKKYVEENGKDILNNTNIITEENGHSTVEELSVLREFIEKEGDDFKTTILASEFFIDRVKLYAEYILKNYHEIKFIASKVPEDDTKSFREIEKMKFEKSLVWLKNHKKGDCKKILLEQKEFEKKIIKGEVNHPVSE